MDVWPRAKATESVPSLRKALELSRPVSFVRAEPLTPPPTRTRGARREKPQTVPPPSCRSGGSGVLSSGGMGYVVRLLRAGIVLALAVRVLLWVSSAVLTHFVPFD